jgi:hypothetical protein
VEAFTASDPARLDEIRRFYLDPVTLVRAESIEKFMASPTHVAARALPRDCRSRATSTHGIGAMSSLLFQTNRGSLA